MKRKLALSGKSLDGVPDPSTPELTVYDVPPAILEARHQIKALLESDDMSEIKRLGREALERLNVAVRAMAIDDLALVLPQGVEQSAPAA